MAAGKTWLRLPCNRLFEGQVKSRRRRDALSHISIRKRTGHRRGDAVASEGRIPDLACRGPCDWAPPLSKWVGIGIGCTRQTEGDWMEGTSVELRGIDAPIAL